jgi:hypothetical protein
MRSVGRLKVTRDNLEVLDATLDRCRSELEKASRDRPAHAREFRVAIQALEGIQRELREGVQRPTGVRSGAFTRYVLDEEPQLVMEPELRDTIKEIEHVYSRY